MDAGAVDRDTRSLLSRIVSPMQEVGIMRMDGQPIRMPARFAPDPMALEYHNQRVFKQRR